jgi:hypothetical protein
MRRASGVLEDERHNKNAFPQIDQVWHLAPTSER